MAKLGSAGAATSEAQRRSMEETVGKGICPFCHPDPATNPIIRAGEHWRVWHNPFPYKGLRQHIIFATRAHVTSLAEVTPLMAAELFGHIQWATEEFKVEGGGLLMRFGDPLYHGGSIAHLHAHLEVPDLTVPVEQIFYKARA